MNIDCLLHYYLSQECQNSKMYILMKTVDNWALCDHMCKSLIYNNSTCLDKLISEWV